MKVNLRCHVRLRDARLNFTWFRKVGCGNNAASYRNCVLVSNWLGTDNESKQLKENDLWQIKKK